MVTIYSIYNTRSERETSAVLYSTVIIPAQLGTSFFRTFTLCKVLSLWWRRWRMSTCSPIYFYCLENRTFEVRRFQTYELPRFECSEVWSSLNFQTSEVQKFRTSEVWKFSEPQISELLNLQSSENFELPNFDITLYTCSRVHMREVWCMEITSPRSAM